MISKRLCRERTPSNLTHFQYYTKKSCMYECLISKDWFSPYIHLNRSVRVTRIRPKSPSRCPWNQEKIEAKCKCKSILFPTRVNISNYELPTCSFVKQAVCASKMVKLFEYNTCDCLPECHAERYEIVSHQYGSLSLKDHRIMVEGEFKR